MNVPIPCLCPPRGTGEARHPDGDTVTLREVLEFTELVAIRKSIIWRRGVDPLVSPVDLSAMLTEFYLLHCIDAWTLVDDKGRPVEPTPMAVREHLLPNLTAAMTVSDAADDLYTEPYMLPLVEGLRRSSQTSSPKLSTSATNGSGPKRQKHSKQSSTSTTQTAGTAATP